MANTKSSKKRIRTAAKKQNKNARINVSMDKAVKDYLKLPAKTAKAFASVQSIIDKAVKTGLSKKTAARRKSRLAKKMA